MKPADDAVMIDSTTLSIDEVFQRVMAVVQPLLTST
ncbi:MAG: (d)CMP kinase [Gammaproteobacteria bacterium]